MRLKDEVVKCATAVQENCADILEDAKEINKKRQAAEDAAVVEDACEEEKTEN